MHKDCKVMETRDMGNTGPQEEYMNDFIRSTMRPVSYMLRKTRNGGIELLGGYQVSEYRNSEKVAERIEWHVIPMLEVDELPL